MSGTIEAELAALGERWRARARMFMAEAEQSFRPAEVVRLTAMASTLEWAAGELALYANSRQSAVALLPPQTRDDESPQ